MRRDEAEAILKDTIDALEKDTGIMLVSTAMDFVQTVRENPEAFAKVLIVQAIALKDGGASEPSY